MGRDTECGWERDLVSSVEEGAAVGDEAWGRYEDLGGGLRGGEGRRGERRRGEGRE
jgi:hypothetical protein